MKKGFGTIRVRQLTGMEGNPYFLTYKFNRGFSQRIIIRMASSRQNPNTMETSIVITNCGNSPPLSPLSIRIEARSPIETSGCCRVADPQKERK